PLPCHALDAVVLAEHRVEEEGHAIGAVTVATAAGNGVLARIRARAGGLQVAAGGVAIAVARSVREDARVVDGHPRVPERRRLRLARARVRCHRDRTGTPVS